MTGVQTCALPIYAISAPADEFDHVSRIIKLSADQRIDDNNYIGAEYGK